MKNTVEYLQMAIGAAFFILATAGMLMFISDVVGR